MCRAARCGWFAFVGALVIHPGAPFADSALDAGETRQVSGVDRTWTDAIRIAAAVLESTIETGPDPRLRELVDEATSRLHAQDFTRALAIATELSRRAPGDPAGHNLAGAAYLGKGDRPNARLSFERALKTSPEDATALLNLAQLDLQDKQPGRARARLDSVLARVPSHTLAMLGMAKVALFERDPKNAIRWLERARDSDPKLVMGWLLLASQYLDQGSAEKAVVELSKALEANVDQPQLLAMLGRAQLASGQSSKAIASYARLVALQPKSARAHFLLAGAQIATGRNDDAMDSLHKAVRIEPKYLDAHSAMISLDIKAGRFPDAIERARQLQSIAPDAAVGWVMEGEVHAAQRRFAPALLAFDRAWALGRTSALAIRMHAVRSEAGERAEADRRLVEWLEAKPADVPARVQLAASYLVAGQNAPAAEQYRLALQQRPNHVVALNNLAALYQIAGDPRAKATAEAAYRLSPDAPGVQDTLGWILAGRGELPRAVQLLGEAARKAPDVPEIRYHYAAALAKSGKTAQARSELERLLSGQAQFKEREAAQSLLRTL